MKFLKSILSDETLKSLNEKLGDEVVKQINEKLADFEINIAEEKFIPKVKFDEVNNLAKDYKGQIVEREKQIEELGKFKGSNEELQKKIEELSVANEATKQEYESKLLSREKEYALNQVLTDSKVRNKRAVKALLDEEKITFAEGKIVGVEDQIKAIKESDPYLFEVEEEDPQRKGGFKPKTPKGDHDEFAEFRRMR